MAPHSDDLGLSIFSPAGLQCTLCSLSSLCVGCINGMLTFLCLLHLQCHRFLFPPALSKQCFLTISSHLSVVLTRRAQQLLQINDSVKNGAVTTGFGNSFELEKHSAQKAMGRTGTHHCLAATFPNSGYCLEMTNVIT